jgi:hypothetical protein
MSQHTDYSPRQERNWFLWGWLALVILNSLFTLVSFLTGGSNPLAYITPSSNVLYNPPSVIIVNLAALVSIPFCIAILMGYRVGYYGLVLSYIVMTIASLTLGFNIGMVLITGLIALITWVLLRRSWPQMK